MASAASSVQPPANTANCRNSSCSSAVQQRHGSMRSRRGGYDVEAGTSRASSVESSAGPCNRANIASGDKALLRAAVIWIAKGIPSSRRSSSATCDRVLRCWGKVSAGPIWPVPRNSAPAGAWATASGVGRGDVGTARPARISRCSRRRFNGSRLVTSTRRCGQIVSNSAIRVAAGRTCSKLSRTSRRRRDRRYVVTCSRGGWAAAISSSQGLRDGGVDVRGVLERHQIDKPDSIGEGAFHAAGRCEREAGFADAARP